MEHRIGRLVQLGVRQSRYFGGDKTLFQLLLTATVANLTLVAGAVRDATVSFARLFLAAFGRDRGRGTRRAMDGAYTL